MTALGGILKEFRGAVGRDLAVAGYTWADVGTARLPWGQFASFVCHSPPGTAVYHERTQGWSPTEHLLTDLLETQDWLIWSKTEDGHKNRKRPKPRPRPGATAEKAKGEAVPMTVEEYVKRSGLKINLEGRD